MSYHTSLHTWFHGMTKYNGQIVLMLSVSFEEYLMIIIIYVKGIKREGSCDSSG